MIRAHPRPRPFCKTVKRPSDFSHSHRVRCLYTVALLALLSLWPQTNPWRAIGRGDNRYPYEMRSVDELTSLLLYGHASSHPLRPEGAISKGRVTVQPAE